MGRKKTRQPSRCTAAAAQFRADLANDVLAVAKPSKAYRLTNEMESGVNKLLYRLIGHAPCLIGFLSSRPEHGYHRARARHQFVHGGTNMQCTDRRTLLL